MAEPSENYFSIQKPHHHVKKLFALVVILVIVIVLGWLYAVFFKKAPVPLIPQDNFANTAPDYDKLRVEINTPSGRTATFNPKAMFSEINSTSKSKIKR